MTDGILLAEIQGDPLLRGYDTIIIDEAHERSLNIDFLLGFLKRLLPRRPDLRVIVSSATLETERFSDVLRRRAGDRGLGPHVSRSTCSTGRRATTRPTSPTPSPTRSNEITELDPRDDILVFLPGEREIREAMAELEQRALPHTVVLPLYARLSAAEQQRVFQTLPQRRVVLATNVAETSLTIPGIVYVVDTGRRARQPLRRAHRRDAAPRRADLAGQRRSAQGPLRPHARAASASGSTRSRTTRRGPRTPIRRSSASGSRA